MPKVEVEVGLKTTAFQRGLDGLRKMAGGFQQQLGRLTSGIGNAGRNLANWNVSRMRDNVDAAKEFADAINDLADVSGESVEGLQQMAYAAEQTAGDLEGFVKGMNKANQAALDAADGNAAAAKTFQDLQIDPAKFLNASMVEQTIGLADAFEKLSESGDPTLQFMDLLGAKSKDMIALLRQGKKDVSEMFAAAPLMSADAMKKLDELDRAKKDDLAKQRAAAGNSAVKVTQAGMAWDKLKRGEISGAAGSAGAAAKEIMAGLNGEVPKLAGDGDPAERMEKRKRLLKSKSKVLDPDERTKLIEQELEVDFQNALSKATGSRKAHLLGARQSELKTKSRDAEDAGDEAKAREYRIQAKQMQPDIDEAFRNYDGKRFDRTMVTSSMQEVGGGGAAVAFGGMDLVVRQQADDVKMIRTMLTSAVGRLQPASRPIAATNTKNFQKKP